MYAPVQEEINEDFIVLCMSNVHTAIAYFLQNHYEYFACLLENECWVFPAMVK